MAEDDYDVQRTIVNLLGCEGMDVTLECNGHAVIDRFISSRPPRTGFDSIILGLEAQPLKGYFGLPTWVKQTFGWLLQTVLGPAEAKGVVVLPKRWIVERTFAWLARCRRHGKDYERTTGSSESRIYLSMSALLSRRLARPNQF